MTPEIVKGFVALLRGKTSPNYVAAGFAVGAILGLIPKGNLLGLFFFLLFFLTHVDKAVAFISTALMTPVGFALDPIAHRVGRYLLVDVSFLKSFWTALYNVPVIPWTKFNNTVVLGQLVMGLILFLPLFFLVRRFVLYYQNFLHARIEKLKMVQALKTLWIYKLYLKYREYVQ